MEGLLISFLPNSPKIISVGNSKLFGKLPQSPGFSVMCLQALFNCYITIIRFYIRSQRDPTLYWFLEDNGTIVVSRDYAPTPFVVELRVPLGFPKPAVLIGSDDIVISVPTFSGKGKIVSTANDNGLIVSERQEVFKFSDLIDSFERTNIGTLQVFGLYKNDKNRGEVWELV